MNYNIHMGKSQQAVVQNMCFGRW